MNVVLVIGIALIVLLIVASVGKKNTAGRKPRQSRSPSARHHADRQAVTIPQKPARKSFHGVVVKAGPTHCDAISLFVGKTFPEDETPPLPLPNCPNAADCQCHYAHITERRSRQQRQQHERREDIRIDSSDRRDGGDRRKDADVWKDGL